MRWMVAAAVVLALLGWAPAASAAVTCLQLYHQADTARSVSTGGMLALLEGRATPKNEKERLQRVADATDAALRMRAAVAACAGTDGDNTARVKQMQTWQPDPRKMMADALALGAVNCSSILGAVQNALNQMGAALQTGTHDPMMGFLIDAALSVNTQATPTCSASHGAAIAAFAKQGADQKQLSSLMGRCQPSQDKLAQSLNAVGYTFAPGSTRAAYDTFLKDSFEPAVQGVRENCTAFPELLAKLPAIDAQVRSYEKLKREVEEAARRNRR